MGTPDFAVPCLEALIRNGYDVPLVVTQPDRPKGRGRNVVPPPVKQTAMREGLTVIQPVSIKDQSFVDRLRGIAGDIFVVVAFGQVLPKQILELPRIAAINIHASLLPKYRGPAPIQWAILNGEKETGVTAIIMDEGLDTGKIITSKKAKIMTDDTADSLYNRLSILGAELLIHTLQAIETGDIHPVPQDHSRATYAPMLKKKDGQIDWKMPVETLDAFVRGMSPWPGAFTFYNHKRFKILKGRPLLMNTEASPGTVVKGFPDELRVATGRGVFLIVEIQGESGKRLPISEFLRGHDISPGTRLT